MKDILGCILKCSKDYRAEKIKTEQRKKELEKDIKDLERKINKKLNHKEEKHFIGDSVIGKSVIKLECLKAEIKANVASNKEVSGLLIIKSFALSFVSVLMIEIILFFNTGSEDLLLRTAITAIIIIIYATLLLRLFRIIKNDEKMSRERIRHNTHLIELMDLLIERKKELKDC